MTRDFENMLYLLGCGATGRRADTEHCVNLSKIRELSIVQEAWDVVYFAVREKIISGEVEIPQEIFKRLEKTFTSNVARNIQKIEFNLKTVRALEEQGVRCSLIKGVTVAKFYSAPDVRISSDTDILIAAEDEKKTKKILEEMGYVTAKRAKRNHHMETMHIIGGLLEVHVNLHSVLTKDMILDGKVSYDEEPMKMENGLYTLGVNDGLMYLSAHLVKHLINDGAGIRQIMDLLLYMKNYENEIDWKKYNALMKELHYDNLIAVIKGVGVKYFGMEFENAITEGQGFEEFLDDCEASGLFGVSEDDRTQFYFDYTQRRSKIKDKKYLFYRTISDERGILKALFPPLRAMKDKYSYVNKHPVLLPLGWIQRLFEFAFGKSQAKNEGLKSEKSAMLKRRMDMAIKLGMIEE